MAGWLLARFRPAGAFGWSFAGFRQVGSIWLAVRQVYKYMVVAFGWPLARFRQSGSVLMAVSQVWTRWQLLKWPIAN